jgi:hypothetical protein
MYLHEVAELLNKKNSIQLHKKIIRLNDSLLEINNYKLSRSDLLSLDWELVDDNLYSIKDLVEIYFTSLFYSKRLYIYEESIWVAYLMQLNNELVIIPNDNWYEFHDEENIAIKIKDIIVEEYEKKQFYITPQNKEDNI